MKKKISLATIVFVGISALIAILALFGAIKLEGFFFSLLFTFITLTVAGILTIGLCDMLERKNKMAIISTSLIALSSLLVVLCFWTNLDDTEGYMNLTLIISTLSVCFNLISSSILKLGKHYRPLQTFAYISYSATALYLILSFLGAIKLEDSHLKIFILFIILSFVSLCLLAIFSKKQPAENTSDEYVKITKKEYNELIEKKEQLEKLLKEGK